MPDNPERAAPRSGVLGATLALLICMSLTSNAHGQLGFPVLVVNLLYGIYHPAVPVPLATWLVGLGLMQSAPAQPPQGAPGPGPGNRTTTWVHPTKSLTPGPCNWQVMISPTLPVPSLDDPGDSCPGPHTRRGYAYAIAMGQQVFGYSWAKNDCGQPDTHGQAATSTRGLGWIHVSVTLPPHPLCVPHIHVTWIPHFKVRAEIQSDLANASASAKMIGMTEATGVHVNADASAQVSSLIHLSGTTGATIGPGGVGVQSFVGMATGQGVQEHIGRAIGFGNAQTTSESVVFIGVAENSVKALNVQGDSWGEATSVIFDSHPGLLIEASCDCGGGATVRYP